MFGIFLRKKNSKENGNGEEYFFNEEHAGQRLSNTDIDKIVRRRYEYEMNYGDFDEEE